MVGDPLQPGATVGILGGGQLGRFLAIAAAKLGMKAFVYAPEEDSPAFQVATRHVQAAYNDDTALAEFAAACDVITFEFENVPADALNAVQSRAPVYPPPSAAAIAQDRIAERAFLQTAGLDVAPHAVIASAADFSAGDAFLVTCGNAILKRARDGYDGRGQARVSTSVELRAAFEKFRAPCVLETLIAFEAELSVICVRSQAGVTACYDVPRNTHRDGILRISAVPSGLGGAVEAEAKTIAIRIADALNYVGVLGVELFLLQEGGKPRLLVNEIAPRVHNTGHWTMDACTVSQFENHIRAITGWPLGSTHRHSDAVIRNLLGSEVNDWRTIVKSNPKASLYLYGKSDVRDGRKLGHVTEISPARNNWE